MSDFNQPQLHIACGSYDGTVFAMSYEHTGLNETGPTRLKAEFIDPDAHSGSVTSLAIRNDVIASGGVDEAIQLYSLSRRKRTGCLELHTGSIRHLVFADSRHLLSTGEDACIAVWRRGGVGGSGRAANTWNCIRQMRRHKTPPTALAIHPSSRLAFTLADAEGDHTLRIWCLMRGRQAYTTRLRALNAEGATSLVAVVVPEPPCHQHHFLLLIIAPPSSPHFHRLDILDLSQTRQKALFSARFSSLLSVPPAVFSVDEKYLYLLAGIGSMLIAYRCDLIGNKMEPMTQTRVPGKRFKFLKTLEWPESVVEADPVVYAGQRRLVILVTTDADGSYLRGYAVDLEATSIATTEDAIPSLTLSPVFTYDIHDIRITQVDAAWTSGVEIQKSVEGVDEMEVVDDDGSENGSDSESEEEEELGDVEA